MPAAVPNIVVSCEDELKIDVHVLPLNSVVNDGINRRVLRALPITVDQESSSLLSFTVAFISVINTSKKTKTQLKRCILFFTLVYVSTKSVTHLPSLYLKIKSHVFGFSHALTNKVRNE
jgi:hypothetical protein